MLTQLINEGFLELDVEFGNAAGFFSGMKAGIIRPDNYRMSMQRAFTGKIRTASMTIEERFDMGQAHAQRAVIFTPQVDFKLFDLVSRFVVYSNARPATIAGQQFHHRCANIYKQYPVDEARIPIGNRYWLTLKDTGSTSLDGFERVFYIRDEMAWQSGRKRWVVHQRLITRPECAKLVVRGCNPRIQGPLPMQWLIPSFVKKSLFRIRESRYPNFPIMSVGEVTVSKGEQIVLNTRIEVTDD